MKTRSREHEALTLLLFAFPGALSLPEEPRRRLEAMNRTHCRRGHEYTDDTVYWTPDGYRTCRICRRAWAREYRAKLRRAALDPNQGRLFDVSA